MTMIDFPAAPVLNQEVTLAGIIYVWNGQGWIVKPAIGDSTGTSYTKPESDSLFVNVSGDTMTGDLKISKINPLLTINKTSSGQPTVIKGSLGGADRWSLHLGDGTPEVTGNTGSLFALKRHSDAGVELATSLTISRTDGLLFLEGDPTAPLHATTKQYVDAKVTTARSRNLIINGDLLVDQRTVGGGIQTPNSPAYPSADRWATHATVSGHVAVQGRSSGDAGVPEFPFAMRVVRNGGSMSANRYFVGQVIEYCDMLHTVGLPVVLSFYAYAETAFTPAGKILKAEIFSGTTADQGWSSLQVGSWAGQVVVATSDVALTTSMQRFFITGIVPANAKELAVRFSCTPVGTPAPADFDGFKFTGVQLEIGSAPTPFQHLPFTQQLLLCQRYYNKTFPMNVLPNVATGGAGALVTDYAYSDSAGCTALWDFPVRMRAIPSIAFFNPVTASQDARSTDNTHNSPVAVSASGDVGAHFNCYASTVSGASYYMHMTAESEL